MKQYQQGIKKRREERLRLLREKERRINSPMMPMPQQKGKKEVPVWSSFDIDTPQSSLTSAEHHRSNWKLGIRMACSLFLVIMVYLLMNSENPQLRVTQDFVQEVFQRDFNVQGVMRWYETKLGTKPTFLPSIIKRNETELPPQEDYVIPVNKGLVISPFGQEQQGIIIKTPSTDLPIEVIKEGWVVFVGEKEGLGQTVVIDHPGGEESWYGHLQDVQVLLHDWVDQGEKIGYSRAIQQDSRQGVFYFALKKDSVFVDPLGVISFD